MLFGTMIWENGGDPHFPIHISKADIPMDPVTDLSSLLQMSALAMFYA